MDYTALQSALSADALRSTEAAKASAQVIDDAARYVATHLPEREEIITKASASGTSLWEGLGSLWPVVSASLDPSPKATSNVDEEARIALAAATAKLERNLIAGVYENQVAALPHEQYIRKAIFDVTTFTRIEDENYYLLQALLAELLSNLISPTGGEASIQQADRLLALYLSGGREDDVIIRLLDSRNVRTNLATLHLLNNLTRDGTRLETLLCPSGVRWLAQVLGRMDEWVEASDARFDLATGVLNRFLAAGLQARLFDALRAPAAGGLPAEEITPNQTTLLKHLDAFLDRRASQPMAEEDEGDNAAPSPSAFLVPLFGALARYAAAAMRSGADDARLPHVLAALVLTTECLGSLVLTAQRRKDHVRAERRRGNGDALLIPGGDEAVVKALKGAPFVRQLVDVLQATDGFLPRVKPAAEPDTSLPFQNVKRDLVRLVGLLAFEDTDVGDRVRAAGGVELVLGMCETDERNQYLREHALLAVRNLMTGNPENQAIIAKMAPIGIVGEDGELKPLPQRIKESHDKAASAVSPAPAAEPAKVDEAPGSDAPAASGSDAAAS